MLTVVHCLYIALGCEWQGKLKDWEGHIETCTYKGVNCTFEGCREMLLASQLEEHQRQCGYRPIECEYCHTNLPFNKLQVYTVVAKSRDFNSSLVASEPL